MIVNSKKYMVYRLIFIMAIITGFCTSLTLLAQPSGGPYGPVNKYYELPKTKGAIIYVAPDGKEEFSGENLKEPTNLNTAIDKVKTGDVIILRGGVYRTGNLRFNQGITLQPYANEKPVLKGTNIAKEWKKVENNLWVTSWTNLFPADPENWWMKDRFEKYTPLHKFNDDMVFIDGKFLQSTGSTTDIDSSNFFIDYDKKLVYIGTDPIDHLIEITAFNVAIHRVYKDFKGVPSDRKGPIIKGIKFTQYADTAILIEGTYPEGLTDEGEYGNDVIGTVLENCEISWCSRIGVYIMGDSLTIRNCKVSNTSTEGIYLVGASDALIERTIISKNNIELLVGYFPAAVKIFNQCYRVTCRDNLVIDLPNSNGIWYDVGNVDGVFVNNWVEDVGDSQDSKYSNYRYMSGFFFEISKGAICAGNVFLNCDNGSFVLNSSDVEFYQNTYINSKVTFGRTERSAASDHFGWHPATGPDLDERDGHVFMNNLLVQKDEVHNALLEVWQAPALCNKLSRLQLKKLDNNLYINQIENFSENLFIWSSHNTDTCAYRFDKPSEINKLHSEFAVRSVLIENLNDSPFQSISQKDFRLTDDFSGINSGGLLPVKISKLLDVDSEAGNYIGAYYYTFE